MTFSTSRRLCLSMIGISLLLSSCLFAPEQPTSHYFLEVPFHEQVESEGDGAAIDVRVLFAEVNPVYNRRQIVQRIGPQSARFLLRELWAEDLSDSLSRLFVDVFSQYNLNADSGILRGRNWNIELDLRRLEFVCCSDDPEAHVDLVVTVAGPDNQQAAFRYRDVVPLDDTSLDAFAASVTGVLRRHAEELAEWIIEEDRGEPSP